MQVIVDLAYLNSETCRGMRGAVKTLMISGAPVRGASGEARPRGGFRGIQHCKAVFSESERKQEATLSAGSFNATRASQNNVEFLASEPLSVAGREEWRVRFESIFTEGVECGVAVREIAGYARPQ